MTTAAIIGAAVLLSATYIFEVRPALDEREIRREMSTRNAADDTRPA